MLRLICARRSPGSIVSACWNDSAASLGLYCSSSATPMLFARYAASRCSKADCSGLAPPTTARMNTSEITSCDKQIRELRSPLLDRLVAFMLGSDSR